ncbi:hypothetical protein AUJ14_05905 [Candidatus Micrarchaeota archaeon CG1_02_55_22]|nr:MAG: hypothetical protein AUJ14_05905 [Candidatus Micrarchaeota archaeon CG1_02_55_22]
MTLAELVRTEQISHEHALALVKAFRQTRRIPTAKAELSEEVIAAGLKHGVIELFQSTENHERPAIYTITIFWQTQLRNYLAKHQG